MDAEYQGEWVIITPLPEGQWKLYRQRDTLFCQRDAVDLRSRRPDAPRGQNNVGRGRYNFHWPEGMCVIMTLIHDRADNTVGAG